MYRDEEGLKRDKAGKVHYALLDRVPVAVFMGFRRPLSLLRHGDA